MRDAITTVLVIGLIFIGLPLLILGIRDRAAAARRRRQSTPERHLAERNAYEQRILQPDWARVERHLGRPVPQALRDLYADRALITAQDLEYSPDLTISRFEPLDERAIAEGQSWLGFPAVAIATTDFGDWVYLRPGAAEADTVYLTHHDGGETEVFAESVAGMVDALRRANRRP
jgi:hypothetical protein